MLHHCKYTQVSHLQWRGSHGTMRGCFPAGSWVFVQNYSRKIIENVDVDLSNSECSKPSRNQY